MLLHRNEELENDLTEDLVKALPRWVSLFPVIGRHLYRKLAARKRLALPENFVTIHPSELRISVSEPDQGELDFQFFISNFHKKSVEIDRLELFHLVVGGRALQRRSENVQFRGVVAARTTSSHSFTILLTAADVRALRQGITKAHSLLCTPQATTSIYAEILFVQQGNERFRKTVNVSMSPVSINIPEFAE